MKKKTLVLSGTGNVNSVLVKALVAAGVSVKAVSRKGNAVDGAEGVVFDFGDDYTWAADHKER